MTKQVLPILFILVISLCVCGVSAQTPEGVFNLILCADFSNGSSVGTVEESYIALPFESEPAAPSQIAFALADGLKEWTGLAFNLNDVSFPEEESIIVDWSKDSTLIAGLDEREFKEGFRFDDAVSLNWFMMDSLAATLKRNMEVATVYYRSEGQPLTFTNPEDMAEQGLPVLPIDQPYEGSVFFVSHAGGMGEEGADSSKGDLMPGEPIAEGVFTNSLLQSDAGENMSPYDAACGLFNLVLKGKLVPGTDYSANVPMHIICVDVTDIDGEECYLFSVSGVFHTKAWEYAVGCGARQNVYLMSGEENQLLGSLLDLAGEDMAGE